MILKVKVGSTVRALEHGTCVGSDTRWEMGDVGWVCRIRSKTRIGEPFDVKFLSGAIGRYGNEGLAHTYLKVLHTPEEDHGDVQRG